jgi:hypothetical protein
VILFGERSLRRALSEYVEHFQQSGIIRGRATFCCSLGGRGFIARGRFSAARDWVGSCGIIIKRRYKRRDVPQMNFLTLRDGGFPADFESGEPVGSPPVPLTLAAPVQPSLPIVALSQLSVRRSVVSVLLRESLDR